MSSQDDKETISIVAPDSSRAELLDHCIDFALTGKWQDIGQPSKPGYYVLRDSEGDYHVTRFYQLYADLKCADPVMFERAKAWWDVPLPIGKMPVTS